MTYTSILSNSLKVAKPYIWLVIGALFVVFFQYFSGIKYSPDSNWYLLFSDQIGNNYNFDRLALYAPLYYWSLGILDFFAFSAVAGILFYWWVSFTVILTVLFSMTRSLIVSFLGLAAILSNPTVLSLYRFVWTELGYSVILIVAIYSLYKLLIIEDNNNKYKILFLVAIALLPIQRYIGGYISIYLGLIYLFMHKNYVLKRFIELLVSAIPLIFVVSWNLLLTGHISGPRRSGPLALIENFELAIKVIDHNFRYEWILLFIFILLLLYNMTKKRTFTPFILLLITPIIQFIFQIVSSTIYKFDPISPRFFIVLTPAIILLLILSGKYFFKQKRAYMLSSILVILTILIGLNASYGNFKRFPYLYKESLSKYAKVRKFLSKIENPSTIGIYDRRRLYLSSEYILDPKIIPPVHCQKYHTVGYFRSKEISYIPSCNIRKGHIYQPIKSDNKLDYILVSTRQLPEKWKDMFVNYDSVNLGPFYGLTIK